LIKENTNNKLHHFPLRKKFKKKSAIIKKKGTFIPNIFTQPVIYTVVENTNKPENQFRLQW
jgi:hypothetical protein